MTPDMEAPLLAPERAAVVETAVPLGNKNDAEEGEYSTNDKVVDTKCSLMSKSYLGGILTGVFLQTLSFMIAEYVKSVQPVEQNSVLFAFSAYVFSKYWMPIALLMPAAIVAVRSRSLPGHMRLEAFFESLRFQFGLFFGSLILLSLVNFYSLAATAPWPLLLAYYGVCLTVSFIALCLLQCFVNEVCANVSSIEVIVNYEDTSNSNSATSSSKAVTTSV
eukprot:CAMPEP_0113486184 /NCGR_PEP_ID=MMETSP0014_2-20120614/24866_1 /TAXON_ID=2857 /ORGANISM="Nitzschia sp." /LENGTH=219 /DNA_ID=CAMNT_0000379849 /DNA_START=140 /DNA_END=799 /DNA_ORIENTATION=+ /assembly_acc=CAM_ASM_000159